MDRKAFFDRVRREPFGGALTRSQVDGCNTILDEWERRYPEAPAAASGRSAPLVRVPAAASGRSAPLVKIPVAASGRSSPLVRVPVAASGRSAPPGGDLRWLAYMLATTFHETARSMQPVREVGRGRGRRYGTTYYGRGYVQLTWKANYRNAGARIGVDLVRHPDLALAPANAVRILFDGMIEGWFTGYGLGDFFAPAVDDPVNARRIVNGTDRARLVAGYHRAFLAALRRAAQARPEAPPVIGGRGKDPEPPREERAPTGGLLVLALEALLALIRRFL